MQQPLKSAEVQELNAILQGGSLSNHPHNPSSVQVSDIVEISDDSENESLASMSASTRAKRKTLSNHNAPSAAPDTAPKKARHSPASSADSSAPKKTRHSPASADRSAPKKDRHKVVEISDDSEIEIITSTDRSASTRAKRKTDHSPPSAAPDTAPKKARHSPASADSSAPKKVRHMTMTARASNMSNVTIAQSPRTMTKQQMKHILTDAKNNTMIPYEIQEHKFISPLNAEFKGDTKKIPVLLQFLSSEMEVCPLDNTKDLREWGMPDRAQVSNRLDAFSRVHCSDLSVKSWGKSLQRLFNEFAKVMWPKKHDKVKLKSRHLFGLRFKNPNPRDTPGSATSRSTDGSSSIQSPFSSASTSPFTTPSPRTSKSRRYTNAFVPYFDILQNSNCYVVRIFTPLMKPDDAKNIKFHSNLAQKSLQVCGSYIQGCQIDDQLTKNWKIQKPLTSLICSQTRESGYFDLKIALPMDIKDDEKAISTTHTMWGFAIHFPRRKQVQDVTIKFTSCFGECKLEVKQSDEKKISPTKLTKTIPAEQNGHPPASAEEKEDGAPATSSPPEKTSLIGREVRIEGKHWGVDYAGKTYTGHIIKIERLQDDNRGEYDHYICEIEDQDELEKFSLSYLLAFDLILAKEYDELNDQFQF